MKRTKLRILYVAPRFHTNQIPIIKGWLKEGDSVYFVSHFARPGEDYQLLEPKILGYSLIFKMVYSMYYTWYKLFEAEKSQKEKCLYEFRLKLGFPPIGMASACIKDFQPDVVIVRERCLYNISFYKVCKKKKIPCILYNQSPLWDAPKRDAGIIRKILLPLFPKMRITPVLGNKGFNTERTKDAIYVPFVMETRFEWKEKRHFLNNKINLVSVGRYEPRKQLLLLVEAFAKLQKRYSLQLILIGEVIDEKQAAYYQKVLNKIKEYGIEEHVCLKKNLTRELVFEEYRKADLFILPSTKERASISQLEAMSCSLPVICSNTNGSACYVESGKNGYLFADSDMEDLCQKIELAVKDKKYIEEMSKNSYQLVQEKYQFENYKQAIVDIMKSCSKP